MTETGPKPAQTSWTLVLNTIATVVAILAAVVPRVTGSPLPDADPSVVAIVMAVINIALRFKTTRAVTWKL